MGKDGQLLEAAQQGNLAKVEVNYCSQFVFLSTDYMCIRYFVNFIINPSAILTGRYGYDFYHRYTHLCFHLPLKLSCVVCL